MGKPVYLTILLNILLLALVKSVPLPESDNGAKFCDVEGLVNFDSSSDYNYAYNTKTDLWINDISPKSRSTVELNANARLRNVGDCTYQLKLESVSIIGETVNKDDVDTLIDSLENNPSFFRLNKLGQLHPTVKFVDGDSNWSRNIKRGVISTIQTLSACHLNDYEEDSSKKSTLIYEYDVLGRCRTTYSVKTEDYTSGSNSFKLEKKKDLHTCSLNSTVKTADVQYVRYRNLPEFYQGRLFVEKYECESEVVNGVVDNVECEEKSTYKIGSKGEKGAQAVVKSTLKLKSKSSAQDRMASGLDDANPSSITIDLTDLTVDDSEYVSFDLPSYFKELCSNFEQDGLNNQHSNNFRNLVRYLRSKTTAELVGLFDTSKDQCDIAGETYAQALLFGDSESTIEAVLQLLDKDAFSNQRYITEYPILTALTRTQHSSSNVLNRLRSYIASKNSDFLYLRKLYLVFSSLVRVHCQRNECSQSDLNNWSSLFSANLGTNCQDSPNQELVTSSLKAIGNIGYFENKNILTQCASNKENSLEVRINAIQAFRDFSCGDYMKDLTAILTNPSDDDSEVEINAFLVLVKCIETEEFQVAADKLLAKFLAEEDDVQVLTFIVDYAKEHGLTSFLNPVLANPKVKERFSVNFKELSWNNYRNGYSVMRDAGYELETSVIYASKSWIPRSIRFNATIHAFGMSTNVIDVTLRLQGLTDVLKGILVDKLTSDEFLRQIAENPDSLAEILQSLADKLKFEPETPSLSLSIRTYGADVFYSELNTVEKLRSLALFLRNRDKILYSQVRTIKNYYLVKSRVRQPLSNGLEFNSFFDITGGLLILKRSSKEDKEDGREFLIKNFYSLSGSINKRLEVLVTPKTRLSLKKVVYLNTRVNLNVEGSKQEAQVTYKIKLPDSEEKSLFTLDGRFSKLSSDNNYVEINDFKTDRVKYEKCTSPNFHKSIGLDFCLTVQRPAVGGFGEVFKTLDLSNSFRPYEDDDDDDEDDHDHDNDGEADHDSDEHEDYYKRPKLTLSGPYHYNVMLKNPERLKSVLLQFNVDKAEDSYSLTGTFKAEKSDGYVADKLLVEYKRTKSYTNRGFERKVDFEIKIPITNEVRFKLNTLLSYKKQELFNVYFNFDNKILREVHLELEIKRSKNDNNVIGDYKLEALLDSNVRENRFYRLYIDIVPDAKNIKSYLVVERKDKNTDQERVQLVDGLLTLNHGDSEADVDYDVDFHIETYTEKSLHLYGHIGASLFDSNIDLSLEFTNSSLNHPVNIRLGHHFDGSSKSKSFAELSAKIPNTKLDHGVKVLLLVEIPKLTVNYLEFQLRTPNSGETPYSVHVGRTIDAESGKSEYEGGISNFNIDLSQRTSALAGALIKVDGNNILKSLVLKLTRNYDSRKNTYDHQLVVEKNGNEFAKLNSNLFGSLTELRRQLNRDDGEVSAQELGAAIKLKVMEYTGSLSGKFALEASRARSFHKFNLEFDTVNLFRILLKIISVRTNFVVENSRIEASHEIVRLGELRSFSLKSTNGQLRVTGSEKQFDISYEKRLSNGESFSSNGVATYSFSDFKNFLIKFDVPNHYDFRIQGENSKNSDLSLGVHALQVKLNHYDYQPFGREFSVRVENVSDSVNSIHARNVVVNFLLKEGQPAKLNDVSSLKYAIDLNTKNKFYFPENKRTLLDADNSLWIKISSVNYESKHKMTRQANLDANTILTQGEAQITLPTIFTEPGKTSSIKSTFVYNENKNDRTASLIHEFETDHKLVSSYLKKSKLTLNRKVDAATNIGESVVNIDFSNSVSDSNKNINSKFESNCLTGNCNLQKISFTQNLLPSWNSVLASGKTLNLASCSYERRFDRVKETNKYLLDTALVVKCGDSALINAIVYVRRENNNELPETELRLEGESDIYFNRRKINLKHRKFSPENGLLSAGFESVRLNTKFSTNFEYNRKLDENQRLLSGEYVLTTSTGSNYNKVCTLNIESKDNYYNSLNCRVQTPSIAETVYGYALKVNEVKEILFGRRSIELNVNLPGRTLRVDYNGNGHNPLNTNDDDDDENNEREFNGTLRYFWDYAKDQNKVISLKLKRDNYAFGQSKTTVQFLPSTNVNLKSVDFEIRRHRKSNETAFEAFLSYELLSGKTNRLDANVVLSSDLNTNSFRIEENLQRPALNVLYESKFNKYNGRLLYSNFRAAKLVSFRISKDDVDPRNRRISLELNAPNDQYTLKRSEEENSSGVYTVTTVLSQGSAVVSTLTSKFDSHFNLFNAELDGSKVNNKYLLSFNLYNQSVASASIVKNGEVELVRANVALVRESAFNNLILTLKWNRFWSEIQSAALGKTESQLKENENFNSYLGDAYAVLSEDLKPSFDFGRSQRESVLTDGRKLLLVLADFYSNVSPTLKGIYADRLAQTKIAPESAEELPLYKRVFRRYNELAQRLTDLSLAVRKYSKRLSTYVPRLPVLEYNPTQTDKKIRPFDNNLKVSRPTLNADNLYQFYAEQRNYMKKAGELVLSIKGNMLRDLNVLRFKSLINKYKLRSLQDFTLVGVVYNKRNVIAFNGESKIIKSKCRFLLAHELRRNQFSVLLNNQENAASIISVVAGGQTYDISYDKALVGGKQVALPYSAELSNDRHVLITRTLSGVCYRLHKDLEVCCNEDSRSCSVALTRWFSGKVNGFLGTSNNVNEHFEEDYWHAGECKLVNLQLKKPNEEAVKTCYSIFGNHRKAFFSNSFSLIKPNGWRSVCEHVLSNDPKGKCALMRAFVYNAKLRSIEVDEPNECYTCQLGDQKFNIGQKVPSSLSNQFRVGTDFVFMILPCDSSYSLENLGKLAKKQQANKNNRIYLIKVGADEPSIVQDGGILNVDVSKANLTQETTQEVSPSSFKKALLLSSHLFAQRVATQRRLIIVSCGNCLDYSLIHTLRASRYLNERNIIVTSWGKYDMKDLNNQDEASTETIIGYNADNVFLHKSENDEVDTDGADGYKVEHTGDLCHRLALKTDGNVFDINYIKDPKVLQQVVKKLEETKVNFKTTINRCERIDTSYGDIDDFSISRTREN